MKKIKLSECTNPEHILLYDGKTVGLQYVLRQIFNEKKLPEIRLCINQEQFDKALETSLATMSNDLKNGNNKEFYLLGNIDTLPVEIDIEKKNIEQLDEDGYSFKIKF